MYSVYKLNKQGGGLSPERPERAVSGKEVSVVRPVELTGCLLVSAPSKSARDLMTLAISKGGSWCLTGKQVHQLWSLVFFSGHCFRGSMKILCTCTRALPSPPPEMDSYPWVSGEDYCQCSNSMFLKRLATGH